ncbi:GcrA cell cycle regulator [Devosia sp. H5989]|nr:GcrA cell cycle regulator [Devosia sp. H5989]
MSTRGRPALWNDEAIARLKTLWAEGLSAGQIAARIGFTRNAVIGKASRLKLAPHRQRKPITHKEHRPKPPFTLADRLDLVEAPKPTRAEAWLPLPGTTPVALEDLGEIGRPATAKHPARWGRCRWPIGQSPTLFCGCKTDRVYCTAHAALARGNSEAAA